MVGALGLYADQAYLLSNPWGIPAVLFSFFFLFFKDKLSFLISVCFRQLCRITCTDSTKKKQNNTHSRKLNTCHCSCEQMRETEKQIGITCFPSNGLCVLRLVLSGGIPSQTSFVSMSHLLGMEPKPVRVDPFPSPN